MAALLNVYFSLSYCKQKDKKVYLKLISEADNTKPYDLQFQEW